MWKTSLHTSLLCILPCPCLYWGRRRVHMNFLLLFTCLCVTHAQPDVIGSDKPVTVTVGDDVILPCHLGPPFNVRTLTVEWTRDGQYVHVWRQGKDLLDLQDENFRGRTSLFHEEIIRGNISLKLTSVTKLDAGSYTCNVPKLQSQVKKNFVILTVEPGKEKDPGQSDVIGSDKPVTVTVGDNVILPCHLEPPFDVRNLTVEWTRDGEYVHVYRSRKDDQDDQDKNFRNRTSVFHEEMIRGNISLKLTNVTELDAGSYTCNVPKLQSQVRRGFINLTVEPVGGQTDDINTEPGGGTGISTGAKIGIVVAVIAVIVAVAVLWMKRRNRRQGANDGVTVTYKAVASDEENNEGIVKINTRGQGANAGASDGANVGANMGASDGASDGANVGANMRASDGANAGANAGTSDGANVGANMGASDGANVGANAGTSDGANFGANMGASDVANVGANMG